MDLTIARWSEDAARLLFFFRLMKWLLKANRFALDKNFLIERSAKMPSI